MDGMGRGWCRYLDSEEEPLKRVGNAKGECEGMIKSSWRSSLQEPRERWWQDVEDINLIRKQKEGRGEFLKKGLDTHLFKSLGFGIDWFCLRHVRLEKLGDPKRNHMDWMIRRGRLRALSLNFWIPLAWENGGLSQRLRIRHVGLPCKERKFCLLGLGRTGRAK